MKTIEPKILQTLEYKRQLACVQHAPNGEALFAAGYDARIVRWDLRGEKAVALEPLTGHQGWIQRLAFAGTTLLSGDSWGRLIAWKDAANAAEPIWNVEAALGGWIQDLAVNADGTLVAVAGYDSSVKLYDVATGSLAAELPNHSDDLFAVAFHPTEPVLGSGDLRGIIRCWDYQQKKILRTFETPSLYKLDRLQDCGGIRRLKFDASGKTLLACGMKEPSGGFAVGPPLGILLDWETSKVRKEMQYGDKSQGFLHDALFHSEGYIIGTSGAMPNTGHLWFWNPEEAEPFFVGKKMPNGRALSVRADGKQLAFLSCISANGNGRPKDKPYLDGTAKILMMKLE